MTVTSSSPKRKKSPRTELKIALQMERSVGRQRPICAVCNQPIIEAMEMHEVFLTKADVQGAPKEVQELINCRENCVLLHPKCHPLAQFKLDKAVNCMFQLILFNGYERIFEWLSEMQDKTRCNQAAATIRMLNQFVHKLQSTPIQIDIVPGKSWVE